MLYQLRNNNILSLSHSEMDGIPVDIHVTGELLEVIQPPDAPSGRGGQGLRDAHGHPVVYFSVCVANGFILAALAIGASQFVDDNEGARELVVAGLVAAFAFFVRARSRGIRADSRIAATRHQIWTLTFETLLSTLILAAVLALLSWSAERLLIISIIWLFCSLIALTAMQGLLGFLFSREPIAAKLIRHVAIVGSDRAGLRMQKRLGGSGEFCILGLFDDVAGIEADPVTSGGIDQLIARSAVEPLDAIVVALPYERRHELPSVCDRLRTVLADIYVAPYLLDGAETVLPEARLGLYHFCVAQRRPLDHWQVVQKNAFDRILGALFFVLLLPVLLCVAVAVKLDTPGPIIFRQTRLGLRDRPFTLLKFRTMRHEQADPHADRQTARNDDRVTAVGRVLRRLSLDELPQLINVLRGEMSLVGPRPHALNTRAGGELLRDALADYVMRSRMKPGITGWAQVNGARGELITLDQLRERVHLDLDYMRRWSLLFDIRVILLTVTREIFSARAF
jgi:Undecaprenyl-phosphate glucose phosphotransferase